MKNKKMYFSEEELKVLKELIDFSTVSLDLTKIENQNALENVLRKVAEA